MAVAWCDYNGLALNVVTKWFSAKTTIDSAADTASGISSPSGFPLAGMVASIPGEIRECATEIDGVKNKVEAQARSWAMAEGNNFSAIDALNGLYSILGEQPEILEIFNKLSAEELNELFTYLGLPTRTDFPEVGVDIENGNYLTR